MCVTHYIEKAVDLQDLGRYAFMISEAIRVEFPSAKAIAFAGLSGTLMAVPVCMATKLDMMAIRKESAHSQNPVECLLNKHDEFDYVIIDDLIELGGTVKGILSKVQKTYPHARCAGIVLYHCYTFAPKGDTYTAREVGGEYRSIPVVNVTSGYPTPYTKGGRLQFIRRKEKTCPSVTTTPVVVAELSSSCLQPSASGSPCASVAF